MKNMICKRIFEYIKIKRQMLILVIAVVNTLVGAAVPILYGTIVDKILINREYNIFYQCILIYLGLIIAEIIINYIQNCIIVKTGEDVALKFRRQIYNKVCLLDYNSKNKYGVGNIISLYNSDIFQVTSLLSRFVYDIVLQIVTIIVIVILMFYMDVYLALSVVFFIPVFFIIFVKLGTKTQSIVKLRQETYVEINNRIQEDIKGSSFLQIPECIKYRYHRIEELFIKFFKVNYKFSKFSGLVNQIGTLLASFADVIVLAFGGYLFMDGKLSIGIIIAFESYAAHLFNPILSLVSLNQIAHIAKPSLERIFGFVDIPSCTEEHKENIELTEDISSIRFEDVSFSYDEKEVLKHVSLAIKPKSFHFIIGESGCGKSTLCALLAKMMLVKEGSIYINDKNINSYISNSIRKRIYYLHQESIIYNGTIRENIELGHKYTENEILNVLDMVCLTKIGDNPIDLNNPIDANGDSLSGGEKRKLVLARALIRKFDILILDEPTNGIDLISRKKLITNLKQQATERTIIIVSHNVEEFMLADSISVIAHGNVVLEGTYNHLIKNLYFKEMILNMEEMASDELEFC